MTEKNSQLARVRFAPSPTGYLHIGGARTALFNYLFARHHQGEFLLRIEDTDTARSDREMTGAIFRSLEWLGLQWDGEPVIQSSRIDVHRSVCERLVESGNAYYCFCSPEDLARKRESAQKEYKYDRTCLALSAEAIRNRLESRSPKTIRFRVPDGCTEFPDRVRGKVTVQNGEIDDFVILRSGGQPVYQVAVVADDHDMGITHVIRGDDHLSNTPKQILLYQALGWSIPEFAHVPMILGSDKKRLSKRLGAASVEEYWKAGYLPQALANSLALVGWSPGGDREIMSLEEMADVFSLEGISRNAGVFDEKKLEWMNGQYIQTMENDLLLPPVRSLFTEKGFLEPEAPPDEIIYLQKVIGLVKTRARKMDDFLDNGIPFFRDPDAYDEKAVHQFWSREFFDQQLPELIRRFDSAAEWKADALEKIIRGFSGEIGLAAAKIIHPIRLALTGRQTSPGLFEMMELLGKETTIKRLRKSMEIRTNLTA